MNSKVKYNSSNIKLAAIAEHIIITKAFEAIFEELFTAASLIKEEGEDAELSSNEKAAMDKLIKTFSDELQKAAPDVKKTLSNPKEMEKLKKEFPNIAKLEDKVKEGKINEEIITVSLILGIVASFPKIVEIFGNLLDGLSGLLKNFGFKKGAEATAKLANDLVHKGHELHDKYIETIQWGLGKLVPQFNVAPEKFQKETAEMVYVAILAVLCWQAGTAAVHSFAHSGIAHAIVGGIEALLSAVKSGEVGVWLQTQISASLSGAQIVAVPV